MANGLFHLHNADAQLVFPDDIGGFEHLDADLAGLCCIRLANPDHAIPGALVVALQPELRRRPEHPRPYLTDPAKPIEDVSGKYFAGQEISPMAKPK